MTPVEFKTRFPEFTSELDARIQLFIDDSVPAFDVCRWGEWYSIGVANYVAHNLAIANSIALGDASSGFAGGSAIANSQSWTTKKVGDVSVTRGEASGAGDGKSQKDSPFFKTIYGQEYLRLLRMVGIGAVAV
jgi:hypothetical protein